MLGPTVIHIDNPLLPQAASHFVEDAPTTIRAVSPKTNLPTVCKVNGHYVLREEWDSYVDEADVVVFVTLPQGGGGDSDPLTVVVSVAMIAVGVMTGNAYLIAAGVGVLAAGLVPVPSQALISDTSTPSSTYNIAFSANSARVGQAIPIPYGLHLIVPDFASNPYNEYDEANAQYYNAIYCLGLQEKHEIKGIFIDDTSIANFEGVTYQLIGGQYGFPSSWLVNPAVVTAPEVTNQELLNGKYIGGFTACGPGLKARKIGLDFECPRGLYKAADDGDLDRKDLSWQVEARSVDQYGQAVSDWVVVGTHNLSGQSPDPIRKTFFYELAAARYEFRVTRLDAKDTSVRAGHELRWTGLKAYVDMDLFLNPKAVHLAIRVKASNQISGLSSRKITVLQQRHLKTWHPVTGWSDYQPSNSIAWAIADVLKNTDYGGSASDSQIDLNTLYELDQLWSKRGDEFNGIFDSQITVWAAARTIAACGRAVPIMGGSIFTIVRDSKPEVPTAMFSMDNIEINSFSIDYRLPFENDNDGVQLEYFDRNTWSVKQVVHALPGISDVINPLTISLKGITNAVQASNECKAKAYDLAYRRKFVNFTVEFDGYLIRFGDLIAVNHDLVTPMSGGIILEYDDSSKIIQLSEPINTQSSYYYIDIADQYGDVHGPFRCVPTAEPSKLLILYSGSIPIYTGFDRDKTRYSIGTSTQSRVLMCKVKSITPADDKVQITAVVDDERMYFDADYEAPIGGVSGRLLTYAPDTVPPYANATAYEQSKYGFYTDESGHMSNGDEGFVYA